MPKTSDIWNHFTRSTDDVHKAKCNICAHEVGTKGGTTNMWRHYNKFHKQSDADEGQQPPPLPSTPSRSGGSSSDASEPDIDEPTERLARMIALHGYDPSIVDDDSFRSFVESLNPEFRVPSRVDIEAVCREIFDEAMEDTDDRMQERRVSIAVGKAKVIEKEVVYSALSFIDDEWCLHKVIADVYLDVPSPYHHGPGTTKQICVESQLLDKKVHLWRSRWFASPNGRNDGPFMMAWGITNDHSKLQGYLDHHFSHSKALRRKLVCTTFMDNVLHSVAELLYLHIGAKFREYIQPYDFFHVLSRHKREELLSRVGVDPWACKEAWYSWYCFLVMFRIEYSYKKSEFTELLCKIWGEIYRIIKIITASSCPTSNLCLLELFKLRKILQSEIGQASGGRTYLHNGRIGFIDNKDVTTVLTELRDILDKAIQESYLVWSIPLVLDPRYNLRSVKFSFRDAFDEPDGSYFSEKITTHIKELYSDYVNEAFEEEHGRQAAKAEFDSYLNFPSIANPPNDFDILNWWKVDGSLMFPTVARMARDALAMPTCSQLSSEQIAQVKCNLRLYG